MPVDAQMEVEAEAELEVTILEPLKQGGQKTVLLVEKNGEQYVMKVMSTGSSMPDALKRARREVELLQSIDDPNVVKVAAALVELGEPPAGVAWLEQKLDGEDLGEAIGNPWDAADAKEMGIAVAKGLSAMHSVKVVHRDLSSNNVRKVAADRYVVMDPGLARHTGKSQLTAHGQPGTLGYMSPEHLQGFSGAPTPASDVFCVGILLYEALTGAPPIPFTGDLGDYATRLAGVEMTDIKTVRPDLEDSLAGVIGRCLHQQPARRYRNGKKLAEALEAI